MPSDTPIAPESHAALVAALSERYLLERELGRGGMAVVYLARDLRHERPVALKVILPAASGEPNAGRFDREIRVTAALQHPNIHAGGDRSAGARPRASGGAPPTD